MKKLQLVSVAEKHSCRQLSASNWIQTAQTDVDNRKLE